MLRRLDGVRLSPSRLIGKRSRVEEAVLTGKGRKGGTN
jgi:hypothetical protein